MLFFFLISFCSAVSIKSFECPEQSFFNHDFLCSLDIEDVSGLYDVKVYITGNDSGINKIWGDKGWTRADWYLKSVINKDGIYEIKILIDKEFSGEAKGILRLRESGSSYSFYQEEFYMQIGSFQDINESEEEINESDNITSIENETIDNETADLNESEKINLSEKENNTKLSSEKEIIFLGNSIEEEPSNEDSSKKVINLNSDIISDKKTEVVYESKSEKIKRYSLYVFIGVLFLAFVYLLIDKLKNGNRNYDY